MQFVSAQPLIDQFKDDTFQESDVGPYFMVYMIFMAAIWIFAFGEPNPWDVGAAIASVPITIMGVLHLKKQNGESFGNQFLSKYFTLGWVITVRVLLLIIPSTLVLFGLATIVGGDDALDPAGALLTIAVEILYYWWLGSLLAQTHRTTSSQGSFSFR